MVDAKDAEAEEKGDKAVDDEAEKMIAEAEDRVQRPGCHLTSSWRLSMEKKRD